MADDIDIEEHNFFQTPQIVDMYSQVPNIKSEPEEYEDNYAEYSGMHYDEGFQVKTEPMDCEPTELPIEHDVSHSLSTETQIARITETHSNRIILGNKPCPRPGPRSKKFKLKPLFVSLEDWGERLNSSPCFCKECETLFATRNAIDAHNMTAHSFLVPVDSPPKEQPQPNYRFCNHCNTYFEDDNLLIQHLYDLIQAKQKSKEIPVKQKIEPPIKVQAQKVQKSDENRKSFLCCQICSCLFISHLKFKVHCAKTHGLCQAVKVSVEHGNFACHFCPTVLKSSHNYNRHLKDLHRNEAATKTVPQKKLIVSKAKNMYGNNRYKCIVNLNLQKMHQNKFHGLQSKIVQIKNSAAPSSKLPHKAYNKSKLRLYHTAQFVPKNVLFKCDKCPKHFTNSITAISHASQTDHSVQSTRAEWKCPDCNRIFRTLDRELHELQHKYSTAKEIRVYVIHDHIYARVLIKCPTCEIYFEERLFMKHTKRPGHCGPTFEVEYCSICKLKVNNISVHSRKHTIRKLIKSDFIKIEDLIQSKSVTSKLPENHKPLKRKLMDLPEQIPKKKIGEPSTSKTVESQKTATKATALNNKMTFFYCDNCRHYLMTTQRQKYHVTKLCTAFRKQTKICSFCGLRFNGNNQLVNHRLMHKQKNFHLKNFTFRCMKTLKLITPPLPEFHKCKKCTAQFMVNHKCDKSTFEKCKLCKKYFNSQAFALHVQHHKYIAKPLIHEPSNIENTLKMKYKMLQPTWNILYTCEVCDVTTDSYDDVVDHSQKHFNDMQSFDVTIKNCDKCSLNFEESCFKKHAELHSNQDIDRNSFTVLKYDFSQLLTDSWLNVFDSLPKEQMTQILSRSIYVTRLVKMSMLQNGPPEYTIYKCQKCEKIVASDEIVAHTELKCKKYSERHKCTFCTLVFATEKARDSHISVHKGFYSENSVRVVAFNHPDETEFNAKLRSECVISEYSEGDAIKRETQNKSKANQKPKQLLFRFTYYRCEKCYCCISKKARVASHFCSSESKTCVCPECNLVFTVGGMKKHNIRHKITKMNPGDINIKPFNTDIKPGEWRVKLSQCHKCGTTLPSHLINDHRCTMKLSKVPSKGIPTMKLYRCPDCKSVFPDKEYLEKHSKKCIVSKAKRVASETVYNCRKCNVYMLSHGAAWYHKDSDHKVYKITQPCEICGWNFTPKSLPNHIALHHEALNLSPEDFRVIIADVEEEVSSNDAVIESVKDKKPSKIKIKPEKLDNEPKIDRKSNASTEVETALEEIDKNSRKSSKRYTPERFKVGKGEKPIRTYMSKKQKMKELNVVFDASINYRARKKYDGQNNTLFKCDKCDLHFLSVRSFTDHLKMNHQVIRSKEKCSDCNLTFTSRSFYRHNCLNIKDITILSLDEREIGFIQPGEQRNVEDCKMDDSASNINESVVSQSSIDVEQTSTKESDDIEVKTTTQTKQTPSTSKQSPLQNTGSSNKKYTHKLYKCGKCHVYFISQSTCYTHIQHHTPLDAKEYIECKFCNLPFKIRTLNGHIAKHHVGDFNLDEVLVEEYSIDGSKTPKIEIYYAIDKVQSRLVSTTSDEPSSNDLDNNQPTSSSVEKNDDIVETTEKEVPDNANELPSSENNVNKDSFEERALNEAEEPSVTKKYKCQFCEELFSSNTAKEFHESLDHLDSEKNCAICDQSFNASILNELHLGIKDNTFKCCQCGEQFEVQDLTKHAQTH